MKVRSTRRFGTAAARTEQSTLLLVDAGFTIVKAESIILTATPPNGASSSREVTDASTNVHSAVRGLNAAVPFVRATVTFVNAEVTRVRATPTIMNDASRILDAEVVFMGDEVRIDDAASSTLRSAPSGTKFAYPLVTDAFTLLADEFTLLTDDPSTRGRCPELPPDCASSPVRAPHAPAVAAATVKNAKGMADVERPIGLATDPGASACDASVPTVSVRVAVLGAVGAGGALGVARAAQRARATLASREAHAALAVGARRAGGPERTGIGAAPGIAGVHPTRVVHGAAAPIVRGDRLGGLAGGTARRRGIPGRPRTAPEEQGDHRAGRQRSHARLAAAAGGRIRELAHDESIPCRAVVGPERRPQLGRR
jgi:hypothetical protein